MLFVLFIDTGNKFFEIDHFFSAMVILIRRFEIFRLNFNT